MLTLAAFKQWTVLNYLGFGCTWLLFSGWYVGHLPMRNFGAPLFLEPIFLTYALVPFVYHLIRERQEK
jgi:hypothetical protein